MWKETDYEGFAEDPITGSRRAIRHLPKQIAWWDGIFQHEEYESLNGGERAVANLPHQQLADRTEWLYAQLQKVIAYLNKYRPDGINKYETFAGSALNPKIDYATMNIGGMKEQIVTTFKLRMNTGSQYEAINEDVVFNTDSGMKFSVKYGDEFNDSLSGGEDTYINNNDNADTTITTATTADVDYLLRSHAASSIKDRTVTLETLDYYDKTKTSQNDEKYLILDDSSADKIKTTLNESTIDSSEADNLVIQK